MNGRKMRCKLSQKVRFHIVNNPEWSQHCCSQTCSIEHDLDFSVTCSITLRFLQDYFSLIHTPGRTEIATWRKELAQGRDDKQVYSHKECPVLESYALSTALPRISVYHWLSVGRHEQYNVTFYVQCYWYWRRSGRAVRTPAMPNNKWPTVL